MVSAILIACAQSFSNKKRELNCGRAIRANPCTCGPPTARAKQNAAGILLKLSRAVTLEVFPKASYGEIAWVGLALGFDHFHIYGHIAINYRKRRKNLSPGFEGHIVVNIEG